MRFREGVALCEDELFGIECLMKATKVVYHKTPYYHYRINRTSATQHTNGNIQPLQKGFEAIQTLITEQLPEYAVHAECRTMRGNIVLARFCDSCHVLTKENWQKITAAIKALPHYKAARNLLPAPMRAEAMILLRTRRGYILGKKIYKALKKLRQYRIL